MYPSAYEMQLCPFLPSQWMHALKIDLSADICKLKTWVQEQWQTYSWYTT